MSFHRFDCRAREIAFVAAMVITHGIQAGAQATQPPAVASQDEQRLRAAVSNALNALGVFYYSSAAYKKASDTLEEALKHQPDNAAARTNLAMVYYHQGEFEKVIETFKPLIERGQLDQAALTALAVSYFAQGKYGEAAIYYERLSALIPHDHVLKLTLAVAHELSGHPDRAAAILKQLPQDGVTQAQFHVIMGDAHRSQTKVHEAVQRYEKALLLVPNLPDINYWLGVLYSDLHHYDLAGKAFERELEINPQNANAHYSLGAYYLSLGNDLAPAQRHFEETLRLNPDHVGGYLGLMKISLSQQKALQALAEAEKAQARGLEHEELYYLKARALNLLGKTDLAEKELKAFQELKARQP